MEGDEENGENACRFADVSGASRDVMHKLVKRSRSPTEYVEREREREQKEELELSLGLSMNGRFGVDPAVKKMRRWSSVSNIALNVGNGGEQGAERGAHAPLVRTCSMPPDTRRREDGSKCKNVVDGEGLHEDANRRFDVKMAQLLKRSIESVEGATQRTTKESSSCHQFITKLGAESGPTVVIANTNTTDGAPVKNSIVDMPYVSTKGLGPNHNKIEGFLYRYKRGEDVKIVCVCHGMFLSPAEFVRHGGGGEVDYPLKHIVVNPFPLC